MSCAHRRREVVARADARSIVRVVRCVDCRVEIGPPLGPVPDVSRERWVRDRVTAVHDDDDDDVLPLRQPARRPRPSDEGSPR